MGQYYRPCILKKNWKLAKQPIMAALTSWSFDNGAKLMEHSYIGNNFVSVVAQLLGGRYFGHPFVWCGDYADSVTIKSVEHDLYSDARNFEESKEYDTILRGVEDKWQDFRYLINLTKKVYVELPEYADKKQGEWLVHPLPLLTAFGNGRGGGDYGLKDDRVGSWAFDRIGMSNCDKDVKDMKKVDGWFELDD